MPVVCASFLGINDLNTAQQIQSLDHVITASPDYTYNIVPFSRSDGIMSMINGLLSFIWSQITKLLFLYVVLFMSADYVDKFNLV